MSELCSIIDLTAVGDSLGKGNKKAYWKIKVRNCEKVLTSDNRAWSHPRIPIKPVDQKEIDKMAKVTVTKGLIVALLSLVIISLITPTHANWYGKRG